MMPVYTLHNTAARLNFLSTCGGYMPLEITPVTLLPQEQEQNMGIVGSTCAAKGPRKPVEKTSHRFHFSYDKRLRVRDESLV
jgi:hypothetical protein